MTENQRIDEVDVHYRPIENINLITNILFWLLAIISLVLITITFENNLLHQVFKILFICSTLLSFVLGLVNRFHLIPKAERIRRKQNLSDALGISLTDEHTNLYYNNQYSNSIYKLGANTFENSLFSKEIASVMLKKTRIAVGGYLLIWLVAVTTRKTNLDLITWITQIVFSGEIIVSWISLEILRLRHERVYERFYDFFRNNQKQNPQALATILDIFTDYESAKSAASLKLSTKTFNRLNPSLSEKWTKIRKKLKMDS